jgi:hypothetical protein
MIVVERGGIPRAETENYGTAYELYGTSGEFCLVRRQLTSIALVAIKEEVVTLEGVAALLEPLDAAGSKAIILGENAETFVRLVTNAERLAQERRKWLLAEGLRGSIGAIAISDEMALLNVWGGGPFSPDHTRYCNKDNLSGVRLNPDGSIDPETWNIEDLEEDQYSIATQMPVTHAVTAFQLDNRGIRDYRHTSVGTLDAEGVYQPFATIMDPTYYSAVS